MFSVVFTVLLYGIVCQMYVFVIDVFNVELFAAGTQVPILIKISLQYAIKSRDQRIASYVKFCFID